jgi:hypothetical protein
LHLPDEIGQIATGGGGIARLDRLEGGCQLGVQAGLQALSEVEAVDHVDHDREAVGGGHLKGSDVARGPLGSAHPALVGGRATAAHRDMVHRRAIWFQGEGLGRPAIVLQAVGIELGSGVLQATRAGEAATAIARQVVAIIDDTSKAVGAEVGRVVGHNALGDIHCATNVEEAAARAGGDRVAGEGAVADGQRAVIVEDAATEAGGRVAREGAVADRQHPPNLVFDAATGASGVVGEGAVADRQRPAVVDAAARDGGLVAGEGAVADRQRPVVLDAPAQVIGVAGEGAVADAHRAAVEEAAAVEGRAMSNGEGLEGEGDAAIHGEHLRAAAAIKGDRLPAAIDGQVRADGERAGDGDGATTTERDRVPCGGAADNGADLPRARLPTTIGDGQGRSGSRMRVEAHSGHYDAQTAQQTQQDHQEQTRGPTHELSWSHEKPLLSVPPLSYLTRAGGSPGELASWCLLRHSFGSLCPAGLVRVLPRNTSLLEIFGTFRRCPADMNVAGGGMMEVKKR